MHVLLIVDLLTKWRSFCPFAKICVTRLRLLATFANSVCSSCCPQGLGANAMFKALDERIEEKGLPFAVSIWSFAVDTC